MKDLYSIVEGILDINDTIDTADEKAKQYVELKKLEEKLYKDYFDKLDPICKKYNAQFVPSRYDRDRGYDRVLMEVGGDEALKVKSVIYNKVYKEIAAKYKSKFQKLLPDNKHNVVGCVDAMITALFYNPYDKVLGPKLSQVRILDMRRDEVSCIDWYDRYYIEVLTMCDIKNTGV